jgi:hypothetical protein
VAALGPRPGVASDPTRRRSHQRGAACPWHTAAGDDDPGEAWRRWPKAVHAAAGFEQPRPPACVVALGPVAAAFGKDGARRLSATARLPAMADPWRRWPDTGAWLLTAAAGSARRSRPRSTPAEPSLHNSGRPSCLQPRGGSSLQHGPTMAGAPPGAPMAWHQGRTSPVVLLQRMMKERRGLRLHAVEPPPPVAGEWRHGRIMARRHGRETVEVGVGVGVNDASTAPHRFLSARPGLGRPLYCCPLLGLWA